VIQPDALRLGDVHRVSWIDSFRLFFKIPHWGKIPAPALTSRCVGLAASSLMSGSEATLRGCVALWAVWLVGCPVI
jgi:hypothetical protein